MRKIKIVLDTPLLCGADDGQPLSAVIAELQGALAKVPDTYKSDARLTISLDYGWEAGDTSISVEVSYERMQTPEEAETERIERQERYQAQVKHDLECEWRMYAQLKAKFEPN